MNVRLWAIIDSVADVYSDRGVTTFDAGVHVFAVAHELGYPKPLDTGIWSRDLPGMLRTVAARIRTGV